MLKSSTITTALKDPQQKRTLTQEMFGIIAKKYDMVNVVLSFGRDNSWKDTLIKHVPQVSNPVCVDLACGTGALTERLLTRFPDAAITGIDITPEMLEIARKRDASGKIIYKQTDMADPEIADESVDVITGGYALRNAADLDELVVWMKRVLKPGGTAHFLDFNRPNNAVQRQVGALGLKIWCNFWGWAIHRNRNIYGYIPQSLAAFPTQRVLHEKLEKAGFSDIRFNYPLFGMMAIVRFCKDGWYLFKVD